MRVISYVQAINEALHQILEQNERVFLIGQGVTSPWYVGGTTKGLVSRFGSRRIIDTPVSENGTTGMAIGAALAGMHPILVFPRMDFMYYAMDQIANQAANWHYMFGGQKSVPLTIWAIINRGGEQAAQHSQALQAMFMHIPGVKVVMPSNPYDAKGLLATSVADDNPVVYIDERRLYSVKGNVPEKLYTVPIGKGEVKRQGTGVTVVGTSYMIHEAYKAAKILAKDEISVELIDLRSLKPLDEDLIIQSVMKTGRAVVVDGGWRTAGVSAEISALLMEKAFGYLKSPVVRVALPDAPAPASSSLEKVYYPMAKDIVHAVRKIVDAK